MLKRAKVNTGELLPLPQSMTVFGMDDREDKQLVGRSLIHDALNQPLLASIPLDDPFTAEPETLCPAGILMNYL